MTKNESVELEIWRDIGMSELWAWELRFGRAENSFSATAMSTG